jgi:hypothetical protein
MSAPAPDNPTSTLTLLAQLPLLSSLPRHDLAALGSNGRGVGGQAGAWGGGGRGFAPATSGEQCRKL